MALTRAQRRNLDRLATYLEGLPKSYRHFTMGEYTDRWSGDPVIVEYARRNGGVAQCGTVACAVGHGPAAGILFREEEIINANTLAPARANWPLYAMRFTPDDTNFEWAFGGGWERYDNHHWGAAARIRYLLKHGKPPSGFRYPESRKDRAHYREFDKRHAKVAA